MEVFYILLIAFMVNLHLALSENVESIIYCVKPNESGQCLYDGCDQWCASWEYYIYYIDQLINQQTNVTIIFMNGNHEARYSVDILSPAITMMGESQKVKIQGYYSAIQFVNNIQVTIENLTFDSMNIYVSPTWDEYEQLEIHFQIESVNMTYSTVFAYIDYNVNLLMRFTLCKFYHGNSIFGTMKVNFTDCELVNNTMTLAGVALQISGVSKVSNAVISAITCYFCPIVLSGTISFVNNTAVRGGAMVLHTTTVYIDANTNVIFANNTAKDRGGAIFVEPNLPPYPQDNSYIINACFYQTMNCNNMSYHNVHFDNNLAVNGGDDIYGSTSEMYCFQVDQACSISMIHKSYEGHSSISSNPTRICLCDNYGVPQCQNHSYLHQSFTVHPGETFTISAVVVGGDFGTTVGIVHAGFLNPIAEPYFLRPTSQYGQAIESKHCTILNYTMYTNQTNSTVVMYLSSEKMMDIHDVMFYANYNYYTPVFVNITILSCPPGFILSEDPPRCSCYKVLTNKLVKCDITDGIGYVSWSGNTWMHISNNSITYTDYCPLNYCITSDKRIDLQRDPNSQCAFNRAGRLCGGCKDGYSLAIGSSHCIHCPNNNNLALIILFVSAGFLLVFFIGALNLTVSLGMINGLIFYANIVWIYQPILFPQDKKTSGVLLFLRIFIAWINLDFGIETCFVSGLTAFWKIWLQFLFPLYILAIAGLIVIVVRCSTKLSSSVGNRAASVLATVFLLSYMKIMRVTIATMNPSTLIEYPSGSESVIWAEDGNLTYFGFPHILLFLAGLSTALFFSLPYTLVLLVKQCIQRMLPSMLLRWSRQFSTFFDIYFAPLKHKHRYWFGVLLLARGILLICFSSTLINVPQEVNLLILVIVGVILLLYMTATLPYQGVAALLVNGSFLTNLALLSGFALFTETHPHGSVVRIVITALSTGLAFLMFCGIVIYGIIAPRYFNRKAISNMLTSVVSMATNSDPNSDEKQPLLKAQESDRITATY